MTVVETVELLQNAGLGLVLLAVVVFGVAPGLVLRVLLSIYPNGDPRRAEILAELYAMPFLERPLFVGQQFETVLFEGLPHRWRAVRRRIRAADAGARSLFLLVASFLIAATVSWAWPEPIVATGGALRSLAETTIAQVAEWVNAAGWAASALVSALLSALAAFAVAHLNSRVAASRRPRRRSTLR